MSKGHLKLTVRISRQAQIENLNRAHNLIGIYFGSGQQPLERSTKQIAVLPQPQILQRPQRSNNQGQYTQTTMQVHLLQYLNRKSLFCNFHEARRVQNKCHHGAISKYKKWKNKIKFFIRHISLFGGQVSLCYRTNSHFHSQNTKKMNGTRFACLCRDQKLCYYSE
jgi:hypothetical protein